MNMIPTDNIESFQCDLNCSRLAMVMAWCRVQAGMQKMACYEAQDTKVPEVVDCKHTDPRAAGGNATHNNKTTEKK